MNRNIEIQKCKKNFRFKIAVNNINLNINGGKIF